MFTRNEILDALHSAICEVTFTKTNGEERIMKCTLNEDIVPPFEVKGTKKKNEDTVAVWDLDKSAWRSFRVDSVKALAVRA